MYNVNLMIFKDDTFLNGASYIINYRVVYRPKQHPSHIQVRMTLQTRPHTIFSIPPFAGQGTQKPDTKPILQRAKNANTQPTHHPVNRILKTSATTLCLTA